MLLIVFLVFSCYAILCIGQSRGAVKGRGGVVISYKFPTPTLPTA